MQDVSAAAAALGKTGLTTQQRFRLVEAVLRFPKMDDLSHRQAIVHELARGIREQVDSEPSTRAHVAKIVRTCLEFEDGLQDLYAALSFYHPGTVALTNLNAALLELYSEVNPPQTPSFTVETPPPAVPTDEAAAPSQPGITRAGPTDPRLEILRGMNIAARAAWTTLGPEGRHAVMQRPGQSPLVTKDGFAVLQVIELEPSLQNSGAKAIVEIATAVRDAAGAGMSTAALLTYTVCSEALKAVTEGRRPVRVRKGIELAVARVLEILKSQVQEAARDKMRLACVATTAGHDSALASELAEAFVKLGTGAAVIVEEGQQVGSSLNRVSGLHFGRGYVSSHFITQAEFSEAALDFPAFLLFDQPVKQVAEILPLLEIAVKERRSVVLLAPEVDGDALSTLVVNKLRGNMASVAIKVPTRERERSALFLDIAALTGARVLGGAEGVPLESTALSDMGSARQVVVGPSSTVILAEPADEQKLQARLAEFERTVERAERSGRPQETIDRLSRLRQGVLVVRVGGSTEEEIKRGAASFRNGLIAVRAAAEEGVVRGGGAALLWAAGGLEGLGASEDERAGVNAVRAALERPMAQIAWNAGYDSQATLARVRAMSPGTGFDARTGQFVDMAVAGILDPARAVRVALERAAELAARLITTEILTTVGEP